MSNAIPVSVSVSPYFYKLLEKKKFSPTEVFRVGMAVFLYKAGDIGYNNKLNRERLIKAEKFLNQLKSHEDSMIFVRQIEKMEKIYNNISQIKKLLEEIEKPNI